MLMPKKVKHRKTQRGRLNGQAKGGAVGRRSATSAFRPWSPGG